MFQQQLESFRRLDPNSKRKIYLVLFFCFFISAALSLLFLQYRAQQTARSLQSATQTQKTVPAILTLTTDSTAIQKDKAFTVTAILDSGGNTVEAADFVITYDPDVLIPSEITEGTFFSIWPIKKIQDGSIKISGIAALANNKITTSSGKGKIATISFTPLVDSKETEISFDTSKTVVASAGKNILDKESIKRLKVEIE